MSKCCSVPLAIHNFKTKIQLCRFGLLLISNFKCFILLILKYILQLHLLWYLSVFQIKYIDVYSSRILLGVMCAPSPASRSPGCSLWRPPVAIVTRTCASSDSPGLHHFPDYLPYICHSLWFLPQALLFLFLYHVCAFVFLILYKVVFIY